MARKFVPKGDGLHPIWNKLKKLTKNFTTGCEVKIMDWNGYEETRDVSLIFPSESLQIEPDRSRLSMQVTVANHSKNSLTLETLTFTYPGYSIGFKFAGSITSSATRTSAVFSASTQDAIAKFGGNRKKFENSVSDYIYAILTNPKVEIHPPQTNKKGEIPNVEKQQASRASDLEKIGATSK